MHSSPDNSEKRFVQSGISKEILENILEKTKEAEQEFKECEARGHPRTVIRDVRSTPKPELCLYCASCRHAYILPLFYDAPLTPEQELELTQFQGTSYSILLVNKK